MADRPTVIVFRPEPGCTETVRALQARGVFAAPSPALIKRALSPPAPDLSGVGAIAVTSEAAAQAAADLARNGAAVLYAVGPGTARALKEAGAARVIVGPGDGAGLGARIAADRSPSEGAILHVGGVTVRPELGGTLDRHGFTHRRHAVYDVVEADGLSAAASKAFAAPSGVMAALLTSPRVAACADKLLTAAGHGPARAKMTALALSPAVGAALEQGAWAAILSPETPDMDALLDLLSIS